MSNGRPNSEIVRVRNEVLVALKMIYPAALRVDQLLRSLLSVFPTLDWPQFRRDVWYLVEKGYLQRVHAASEADPKLTAWRKRWFRLTPSGLEVAEHLINDPALDS